MRATQLVSQVKPFCWHNLSQTFDMIYATHCSGAANRDSSSLRLRQACSPK